MQKKGCIYVQMWAVKLKDFGFFGLIQNEPFRSGDEMSLEIDLEEHIKRTDERLDKLFQEFMELKRTIGDIKFIMLLKSRNY